MRELKIHVERAVRPLAASPRWKRRMREELWAHISALYQAELAATGSEEQALARVRESFGDPAAVGADLGKSISFIDRCLYTPLPLTRAIGRLGRILLRRDEETSTRHAVRVALLASGLSCLALTPFFVLALGRAADVRPLLALSGAALVIKDFVFVLLCFVLCRAAGGVVSPSSIARSVLVGLGGVLVQIASIPAGLYLVSGSPSPAGHGLVAGRLWPPALFVAMFLVGLVASARVHRRRMRFDQEWASLELEN